MSKIHADGRGGGGPKFAKHLSLHLLKRERKGVQQGRILRDGDEQRRARSDKKEYWVALLGSGVAPA